MAGKTAAGRGPAGFVSLLVRAGLYALAELACALLIGRLFDWGRAEALLFFAFRPFLLLLLALSLAHLPLRARYLGFVLALVVAGLSQSLLLLALGASNPWPEMIRGLAAGALVAFLADTLFGLGRRFGGRKGLWAAVLLVFTFLSIPGSRTFFDRIVLGPAPKASVVRPEVVVMTSLPLIWGEKGAFDASSRPAQSWQELAREFRLTPIDRIDPLVLGRDRLLLLAQPRLLSSAELVTLDSWVRDGGRALILADPVLVWPSALSPGDIRRPVQANMLAPLLSHWNIAYRPVAAPGWHRDPVRLDGKVRSLRIHRVADLAASRPDCRNEAPFMLDCKIGRGRSIIIADSDLLHDSAWKLPGSSPGQRHDRISDNMAMIADLLDRLAGVRRSRPQVQWADPEPDRFAAGFAGLFPIAVIFLIAWWRIRHSRRHSLTYPQDDMVDQGMIGGRTKHETARIPPDEA